MVVQETVSGFFSVATFSSLRELGVTPFSLFLSCNSFVSFEDKIQEPDAFCELLDDDPSFLLSLELDLDTWLFLSFDCDSTLSLEERDGCCGRVWSFLLSWDGDRDFDRDFEQD